MVYSPKSLTEEDYYYFPLPEDPRFPMPVSAENGGAGAGADLDYMFALKLNLSWPLVDRSGNASTTTSFESLDVLLAEFRASLFVYRESRSVLLIAAYVLLFLLATVCNVLVVVVVYRYRRIRSITNCLIVNLSVADLMVTWICMPMAIGTNVYRPWVYGEVMCKLVTYMEGVAVSSSVFTLMAMSIDRYVAINHPITFRKMFNRLLVMRVILVVWLVSVCLFIPVLFVRRTEGFYVPSTTHRFVFCVEKWPRDDNRRLYSSILFVVVYAIPGHVLLLAYTLMGCTLRRAQGNDPRLSHGERHAAKIMRGRRKIAHIMFILALTFALCWLPYNIAMLVLDTETSPQMRNSIVRLLPFALLLGHANSAVNPILYCFLAKTFRVCLMDALRPRCSRNNLTKTHQPLKDRWNEKAQPDKEHRLRSVLKMSSSSSRSARASYSASSSKRGQHQHQQQQQAAVGSSGFTGTVPDTGIGGTSGAKNDSNVTNQSSPGNSCCCYRCCCRRRLTATSGTKPRRYRESVVVIRNGDRVSSAV